MKTNLTWNHDEAGEVYESTDWHWHITLGQDGWDVRDLTTREWLAFDLTLEQAKQLCEDRHRDELREIGVEV